MSGQFYEIMQRFMRETIWGRYAYAPFERDTMSMVENDVREKIVELFPDFYFHAKIVEKEIHISSLFFKKYATAMQFLPCMFSVKESYFYDLYIDNVPVGRISFETNVDPSYGYGYVLTMDPFERYEFIRNAFMPTVETDKNTELPEMLVNKTKIAMKHKEDKEQ